MTLKEIETRLAAIAKEVEQDGADLDALEAETRTLKEQRDALIAAGEKRNAILQTVAGMTGGTPVTPKATPETRSFADMTREELLATPEYRSAWCKSLQGKPLTDVEQRAFTTATTSAGPAIPTELADQIIAKAKQYAPLLNEITLLQVPGGVRYAVEGTTNDAAKHSENADQTDAADTLVEVVLGGYEVTKYLLVSKSVDRMAAPAFESFIVDNLAEALAIKLVKLIISGTGTGEATGVEEANTWGATNSITVGKDAALTTANVLALIALLPGGYDRNAKILMSKKTLFTDFLPLQDKSKNDIVTLQGGTYYVQGYPVMLDDSVTLHEAYLGDFRRYVGNLAEAPNVAKDFLLKKNSYEYLGSTVFDGKPALGEAFVKLIKATA